MRTALLACSAVICCCAVLAWQPAQATAGARLDRAERKVVRIVNRIRARHGLRRVKASRALSRAASAHSGDMLRGNFLGHVSSNGTPMQRRVRRYTRARWIGENIAAVSGRGTARRVVSMWMSSAGHRAVLLAPRGRRIGVGRRWGRLGGARCAVITLDLASRR